MTIDNLLTVLKFKKSIASSKCFNLDFRGYRIMCLDDKFYFQGKESTSRGAYVWNKNPEDCKNKKAKQTWKLIQEIIILNEKTELGKDYYDVVSTLLIQMFLENKTKIGDIPNASGNQYYMAENAYKRVKEK